MKKNIKTLLTTLLIAGIVMIFTASCSKNDNTNEPIPSGTVTDIDGNEYNTITIGKQVWMIENLKTTKYNDGTDIPNVTDNTLWKNLTTPGYCWYVNDTANTNTYGWYNKDAVNTNTYGALYNWYAVNTGNLAPKGWHVPTNSEWKTLTDYVAANPGFSGFEGKALASKTDWYLSTRNAEVGNDLTKNNSSGFTALPAGGRAPNGTFFYIGFAVFWWSSTASDANESFLQEMFFFSRSVFRIPSNKACGFSVRCIKD